ncbi:TPA: E3 ubiquitin-protein ligase nedd4 [Trebouxia sp. C0005]
MPMSLCCQSCGRLGAMQPLFRFSGDLPWEASCINLVESAKADGAARLHGRTSPFAMILQWVQEAAPDKLQALVRLATGLTAPPPGGDAVCIVVVWPSCWSDEEPGREKLPTSHTCFAEVKLPVYTNLHNFSEKLEHALMDVQLTKT